MTINCDKNILLSNADKLHTTQMGIERIKRNCLLNKDDVVEWCKKIVFSSDCIISRKGKNWYAEYENYIITINAHSYTIITAHRIKNNK